VGPEEGVLGCLRAGGKQAMLDRWGGTAANAPSWPGQQGKLGLAAASMIERAMGRGENGGDWGPRGENDEDFLFCQEEERNSKEIWWRKYRRMKGGRIRVLPIPFQGAQE